MKQDLERFAREIMQREFEGYDLDGGILQDIALQCGVIVEVTMLKPCSEGMEDEGFCACADAGCEFPTKCFHLAENLKEEA